MSQKHILVVDDEPDIRSLVQEILEDEGYLVNVAHDVAHARQACQTHQPDLALLDIWMPDEDGISLLQEWKADGLTFPVIMMSGHGTVETAVEATRQGAVDFIEKPISLAKLLMTVKKALVLPEPPSSTDTASNILLEGAPIIGVSSYIQGLRQHISQLVDHNVSTLILGEPGTGKSLIAKNIHLSSQCAHQPFIQLRAETLNTSDGLRQLFGSHSGIYQAGLLEQAKGGTIFIRNIIALPMDCQLQLLSTLESKSYTPIGSSNSLPLDVRFIISSNASLTQAIAEGRFKKELYYRLNIMPLQTLPLREHKEDIPALLEYFTDRCVEKQGMSYHHFNVSAQNRLKNHDWPGNIRELKNLVQRLLIMGDDVEINTPLINQALIADDYTFTNDVAVKSIPIPLDLPLREARAEFEKTYLIRQLEATDGSIVELAKKVGMERTHLYRKLRALGVDQSRSKN